LIFTLRRFPGSAEVLLIDDASSDDSICRIFEDFRRQSPWPVRIFRLPQRGHYTGVFNVALARASGDRLFFLSNDMQVTPCFLNTLLGVLGLHQDIAFVRGTSQYTDSFPEHRVVPPFPLRGYEDILAFSAYVSGYHGLNHVEDCLFSGDAVLLRASAIARLGGFDPQFFGYYSDFDYGLRAQKLGYRLVCARGAWLHHEGAGHIKDEHARETGSWESVTRRRSDLIQLDYDLFRAKWNPDLPAQHSGVRYDFDRLRARDVETFCDFAPPPLLEI
jgi:GT2 family glycosyltransferase